MTRPLRLVVITGSTRDGRFGPTVTSWFTGLASSVSAMDLDVVDLADIELPVAHPAWGAQPSASVAALGARLDVADAFVVVTPEYNHSFPAVLKNAIDLFREEWRAKPVGFVSYGGQGGGLRAVEQLRLVFAELHATSVRDSVSFHGAASVFDGGRPVDPAISHSAGANMLEQLEWWGSALRSAREARPYAEAA
ncbi:NAD(P)H-dependent oxidoreductase [Rhodococcus oryzae]|uniref:NAD(P)H-dependent oxidoreductase n=1 Tax=Rhodococcus oryzae TaxID=2571143 RepID=A0ABY2RDB2_9NOCA|nr:NAD(P)H-dependent oxidoreductase [Rhodococcus oryzae]TJZ73246.1 NAD(P)H-dependent oxidoreductase [Rhodococcus oryzae]